MSTQLPHEEIEELMVADALDGLDPDDRDRLARLMAEHGPDCPDCAGLQHDYREVAGAIASSIDPIPMSVGAEDALIEAIRETAPREHEPSKRTRRWVSAAAIAALLVVLGGIVGYWLAPNQTTTIHTLALEGTAPGDLNLVYVPGQTDAVVVGSGLADPGPGKVYELWYRPSPEAAMAPAGVFTPTNGSVNAPVQVGESFDLVAVTVEPAPSGSQQPTSEPILSASA